MCRLLETIKIQNGTFQNMAFHNERFNRSRQELLGISEILELEKLLGLPQNLGEEVYKCRVLYSTEIHSVEFLPYKIRPINSLRLVEAEGLDYSYKYADRSGFQTLLSEAGTDEILVVKNGFITDTSFSNVVFFDGKKWITPSTFLLNGTKRQALLENGAIVCDEIRVRDLRCFRQMKLINAMLELEESPAIPVVDILGDFCFPKPG